MVTQYNPITESDIDSLISRINAEENDRGDDYTDLSGVDQYSIVMGSTFQGMVNRMSDVNTNMHCYCEADGSIETHNGGVGISMTSAIGDFYGASDCSCEAVCGCENVCTCDVHDPICGAYCLDKEGTCPSNSEYGCTCETQCSTQAQYINATNINKIDTDVTALENQCDCDSYGCTCESACTCVSNQTCSCDIDCGCNGVCGCNVYNPTCGYYCIAKSGSCPSNCECQSQCTCQSNATCGCDTDCSCNLDCNCDDVCSCEYGG